MDDFGVGEVTVKVPAKVNPFTSFNLGSGFTSNAPLVVVHWRDSKKGTAALNFPIPVAEQGPAQSKVFTKPGTPLHRLLAGSGQGPGPKEPETGFESIKTPSINFRYPMGCTGSLILIPRPPKLR